MSYINTEKRVVILFPHKTGTHTLRQILQDAGANPEPRYSDVNNHPTLDHLKSINPQIPDLYEYEVYAFYREPVEKFLSFIAYNYRQHPLMEPYTNVFNYVEQYGYFAPQTRWLKHHTVDVNLLDFSKFEGEMRRLLVRIGITPNVAIPKLNASVGRKTPNDLTPEEIAYIKSMYADDYAFFESKGITFKV
jgi:hypothetical protein